MVVDSCEETINDTVKIAVKINATKYRALLLNRFKSGRYIRFPVVYQLEIVQVLLSSVKRRSERLTHALFAPCA